MASGGSGGGLPITGTKAIVAISLPVVGHVLDVPTPAFIALIGAAVVGLGFVFLRLGWRKDQPISIQ